MTVILYIITISISIANPMLKFDSLHACQDKAREMNMMFKEEKRDYFAACEVKTE